jgi:uncharacterized protein YvpB
MLFSRKRLAFGALFLSLFVAVGIILTDNVRREEARFQIEHLARVIYYTTDRHLASVIYARFDSFRLAVPLHKQENKLTCEVAALRMALNYYGMNITEGELIKNLRFSTHSPIGKDGVWGDPDVGFVGNINGSIFNRTGYGVYDIPIHELALKYGGAENMTGATLYELNEKVLDGHPVVVWGLLSSRYPIYWFTPARKVVTAYPGLHVRVLMGFEGSIRNPSRVILMDPRYGEIRMSVDKFVEDWDLMGRRAIVVYGFKSEGEIHEDGQELVIRNEYLDL